MHCVVAFGISLLFGLIKQFLISSYVIEGKHEFDSAEFAALNRSHERVFEFESWQERRVPLPYKLLYNVVVAQIPSPKEYPEHEILSHSVLRRIIFQPYARTTQVIL